MKPHSKKRICGLLLAAALPCFVIWCGLRAWVPKDWRIFSKSRLSALESEYNLDLSTVTPQRYWVTGGSPEIHDKFLFTVSDPADFMAHCFSGEILMEAQDTYNMQYKCRPYSDSRFAYRIEFEAQDGCWQALLTSYTE